MLQKYINYQILSDKWVYRTRTTVRRPLGRTLRQFRPGLEKICFRWTGRVSKKGATGHFFFYFCKKKCFLPNRKKKLKKKENCGRPTDHNYGHPLDRKQTFFVDSLPRVEPLVYRRPTVTMKCPCYSTYLSHLINILTIGTAPMWVIMCA